MEQHRRRQPILETRPYGDVYAEADHRMLHRLFGAAVEGCEVVCMWNDLAPDHDWVVAVIRDPAAGDFFVCEHLSSEDHDFVQVEPFSSKSLTRISNVLKNDDTPGVCHADRQDELLAAADMANSAIEARMRHHEGIWVRDTLAALGRPDALANGYLTPGRC